MRSTTKLLLSPALVMALAGVHPAFADDVTQIEALSSGTAVNLDSNPVITAIGSMPGSGDGYTYTNYAILAADSTGSIDLFGHLPTSSTYVPAVGDAIGAAGTYSPFDAIPEIGTLTAVTKVSGGNGVPAAIPVTTAELAAITANSFNYLGHYLEVQNAEISGATGNFPVHANGTYTLTDLSGQNPLTLYQWASSYSTAGALGGTPVPTGAINVYGTVDLFEGTPEFLPFSISPAASAAPEPASVGLLLAGFVTALQFGRRRRS